MGGIQLAQHRSSHGRVGVVRKMIAALLFGKLFRIAQLQGRQQLEAGIEQHARPRQVVARLVAPSDGRLVRADGPQFGVSGELDIDGHIVRKCGLVHLHRLMVCEDLHGRHVRGGEALRGHVVFPAEQIQPFDVEVGDVFPEVFDGALV